MGAYKRLAMVVFVIIGALLIVAAFGEHAAQAETKEVIAAVTHDFYTTSTPSTQLTRMAVQEASLST